MELIRNDLGFSFLLVMLIVVGLSCNVSEPENPLCRLSPAF